MPEIDVQWLLPDGAGGAPLPGGGTVRIAGALPGDRVRYEEERRTGRTVHGRLLEVLRPSPDRRIPGCPWDAACGGCDLAALSPRPRLETLAGILQRAFRLEVPPPLTASPSEAGHRARIKLAIEGDRLGYRGARSRELVPIGTCAIARPEVQDAIGTLRGWLTGERARGLAHVELRSDGARVVFAFGSAGPVPREVRDHLAALGDVALDGRVLHGDPVLWLPVQGMRLRAGPRAFYQVNLEVNEALVGHVRAVVRGLAAERVLDLYGGIGNLSLPVAADGVPVVVVESEGAAIDDLRASAAAAGVEGRVEAHVQPAERFDPSRVAFDVAILDPPRAGSGDVLGRVLRNRPRAVVYVACNPVAAAREIREATKQGYRLTDVRGFDLFPQTRHVEAVVVIER